MSKNLGVDSQEPSRLTKEAQQAIDAYLFGYAKAAWTLLGVLGVATLGSILLSLFYVFFRLPDEAADRAFRAWESKFGRYEQRMEDALVTALELRATAKTYSQENKTLQTDLRKIGESLADLKAKRESLKGALDRLSPEDFKRAEAIASSLEANAVAAAQDSAARALAVSGRTEERVGKIESNLDEAILLLQDLTVRIGRIDGSSEIVAGETDATMHPIPQ